MSNTHLLGGFDADLLVVGMGPAGDVLAGLAAMQGLSVIGMDQAEDIHPLPRAAVFDHEIMRIFQMLGVAKSIEPATHECKAYRFFTAAREILLDFDLAGHKTVSGWADSYSLHQPEVERCLRARLRELGVPVLQGTRFLALTQDEEGVSATVRDTSGVRTIRSRFLVGCDGASSTVREALGVLLDDYAFDEPWLVVDTIVSDPAGLPDCAMQICDPARPVTYIRMGERRCRWEFMVKPGEDPASMLLEETISALLQPFCPADNLAIERRAVYRFHGLVADRWRQGRVLLAGDAAHQMPPFAGQGMCSSIRDAANLAWKLAYVLAGKAGMALLDTYQQEREPHVRGIVATAIAMGRVVCLLDEAAAAERNAGMLARKAAGATDISLAMPDLEGGLLTETPGAGKLFPQPVVQGARLDDLLGDGPWLIARHRPPADFGVAASSLEDPALASFAPAITAWLEAHEAPAVLVRPDRTVFATGTPAAVLRAWHDRLAILT
jgi:3-(3-hydroxy-phenyl)propionate hydroxylase